MSGFSSLPSQEFVAGQQNRADEMVSRENARAGETMVGIGQDLRQSRLEAIAQQRWQVQQQMQHQEFALNQQHVQSEIAYKRTLEQEAAQKMATVAQVQQLGGQNVAIALQKEQLRAIRIANDQQEEAAKKGSAADLSMRYLEHGLLMPGDPSDPEWTPEKPHRMPGFGPDGRIKMQWVGDKEAEYVLHAHQQPSIIGALFGQGGAGLLGAGEPDLPGVGAQGAKGAATGTPREVQDTIRMLKQTNPQISSSQLLAAWDAYKTEAGDQADPAVWAKFIQSQIRPR